MGMSPSKACRVVQCPASFKLGAKYPPRVKSEAAEEGILAHDVAKKFLEGTDIPPTVDEDMISGARMWADALINYDYVLESNVLCTFIHPDNKGICDGYAIDGDTLRVWEYKYGHRYVDVVENWQLINYAAAILETTTTHIEKIVFCVVQPRCYSEEPKVRYWELSRLMFTSKYLPILREAWINSISDNPRITTGSQCNGCSAIANCPAARDKAFTFIDRYSKYQYFELSNNELANELDAISKGIDILQALEKGFKAEVEYKLSKNEQVKGYKLGYGRLLKKWNLPIEEILGMGELLGYEFGKVNLITPTQALSSGVPEDIVKSMCELKVGQLKLIKTKLEN